MKTAAPIKDMFDSLVPEYDRFNGLSSLGLDRSWREKVARTFEPGKMVLDVGTGTGDMAQSLIERKCQVVAADFSESMLSKAREKMKGSSDVSFLVASAENLPVPPRSFDGLTSAFVLRNLHKAGLLAASFREFYRVLKPEGQMVHVELTRPSTSLLAFGHRAYLKMILPIIGRSVFGNRWPKQYLSDTIASFPSSEEVCRMIRSAGFERACHYPLSGGIAGLFIGARK